MTLSRLNESAHPTTESDTAGRSASIRWGILGMGTAGLHHLQRLMLEETCQVVAVADPTPALENGRGWGPRLHSDSNAVLTADDVDVVLIATPPSEHASLAIQAVEAGKHVVVESPAALSVSEIDAMANAAARANRAITSLAMQRWDGEFRTAQDVVRKGMLGELQSIQRIARQFVPQFPGQGNGGLWEIGPQFVDQILQLTHQVVTSVSGRIWTSRFVTNGGSGFRLRLEFSNGLEAELESSYGSLAALHTGWVLDGNTGGYSGGRHYRTGADGEVIDVPVPPLSSEPEREYARLIDQIRNPTMSHGFVEARRVIAILEAVTHASQSGESLRVQI